MKKAVFLDRDGVINELVLNHDTRKYEPPHDPKDLVILPFVIESLHRLKSEGFELFIVSNQPDYAKGKTTMESLRAVHIRLYEILQSKGIFFQDFFYCYHHPKGVVPEYSFTCECRKPKPYFILQAANKYNVDLARSWMIGDRDVDIECGKNAGVKTIAIEYALSSSGRSKANPDFFVENLKEAVRLINKTNL